jgi:NTE family protein
MTAHSDGSTRALVLGGGGPVGIGWQAGLLTGLREAGLDLSDADVIVGTSAGSVVGALTASRTDFAAALTGLTGMAGAVDSTALVAGLQALMTVTEHVGLDTDPREAIIRIGKAAEQAGTIDERTYLGFFAVIANTPWPRTFHCTANDARSGELLVWGPESGVPLQHAVAASCAVPLVFPPVSLNGRRYLDGGVISHLNAAAVPSTDRVIVISCFPLAPTVPGLPSWFTTTANRELAAVGATRWLAAVEPRGAVEGEPVNVMDPRLALQAYSLGLRQAERELDRLAAVWTGRRSSV